MVNTTDNSTTVAELRRKAEEQVASQPASNGELNAKRLHHELQVHQVELEMQNEELRLAIAEKSEREACLLHEIEERRTAEAKLAESDGVLRDILESTLSGFWDWNLVKNTEYLSPNFKRMFGYEDHEMENSPEAWQKIILPEDLPGVLEIFDRHVKSHGREPFSNEVRYRHRDGSIIWVICAGLVIEWADDGTPIRMIGCHIDITDRKRVETELSESESKLSTLFASMSEMVVLHDLLCDGVGKPINYRITDCNAAYTRITGITRENAVGRLATELYGTEEPPYLKEYSEVAQSGEPYQYETYFPPMDKHFFISVASQGNNRFATVTTDITESKRMEHEIKMSEERFRLILETVSVVPWEFNIPENRWTFVGNSITSMIGYAPEEWTTLEWWLEIIHPEDKVWVPKYCAGLTSRGEEHSMDYRLLAKDGSFVWVHELVTVEMLDGKPHIMRGVLIDITERKQAEEAIEAARTQLAAKNKELEQLVYMASHDLRSPLVNVDGFSRELEYSVSELNALLEAGDYSVLEKALRAEFPDMVKAIGRIRASTRQMDNLLKVLLKLARAGRAALRIEPLNMNELLGQLAQSFAFPLRETGITMTVEHLPPCQGDAVQVTQVFSNLIDNAIKYHEKDRPGVITIRGTAEGGRALYRVEDNGMGIAENYREKIFELFHRLNPKETEGDGLGLTMVRQILGGMNGEITVESKPGEGSAFIVSLPGAKKNRQ